MGRPQRTVKQVEKFQAYEPGSKHVPIFLRVANSKEKKKEAKQKDMKNEKRREKRKVKDGKDVENTPRPGTSHPVCIKDKVNGDNSTNKADINNNKKINKRSKGSK